MSIKAWLLGILLGGTVLSVGQRPAEAKALQPVKKFLVWVVSPDAQVEREVELKLLEVFADRQVGGTRFSDLFPQGLPASRSEAIERMRSSGCDALLVLKRRGSIRWSNSRSNESSTLSAFLKVSGQASTPAPTIETIVPVASSVDSPFDSHSRGTLEIVKGRATVFDLATEKRLWEGNSEVKASQNLPTTLYHRRIAATVAEALTKAGLLRPSSNKNPLLNIVN